jgi:hypothetical protein
MVLTYIVALGWLICFVTFLVLLTTIATMYAIIEWKDRNEYSQGRYITEIEGLVSVLEQQIINTREDNSMNMKNTMSLTDFLEQEPTEENYAEVNRLLGKMCRGLYEDYKYLINVAPKGQEEAHYNLMQLVSPYHENPELHREIFAKVVSYKLDYATMRDKFIESVKAGEVVDLGDNVVVLDDDGNGDPPTGVTPVMSGIEGAEIAFNVGFVHKKHYEGWKEKNLTKEKAE